MDTQEIYAIVIVDGCGYSRQVAMFSDKALAEGLASAYTEYQDELPPKLVAGNDEESLDDFLKLAKIYSDLFDTWLQGHPLLPYVDRGVLAVVSEYYSSENHRLSVRATVVPVTLFTGHLPV